MRLRYFLLFLLVLFAQFQAEGQTPGMIIKPAKLPGSTVLDPDGDGYVSQKTNGTQKGFTVPPNNDVLQSEIPYVPIVRPDPTGDILRGPVGGFIEIVGVDAAGNNAIMVYNDGTNLLFRFRLGGYAPNSKSYSLMIDTDQKFGFTGPNADPNAVSGNPGFEMEIVLETNFSVAVYNYDGTTSGTMVATHSFDTNCQQSVAISNAGSDPDYFYDFYIPLSDLTSLGVTSGTPLRIVAVTVMNPHPAIGNNALSDVGGVTSGSNLDAIFTSLIDAQTPTTTGNINSGGFLDRSACPTIDPVPAISSTITGTSTEASGTNITVGVYQSNGTTLIGSGTTTVSGGVWTINVSALSPSVTLSGGQVVKATATAAGKGTSYDNCSTQTVAECSSVTGRNVTLTKINGSKGYTVTNTFPAGTVFTWYNADLTPAHFLTRSGGSTYITNPQTSTTSGELKSFSTETGQTFPAGVFYFTFQEPGKCVSPYLLDCQYAVSGTSVAPVITTTAITTGMSSVSGTCGSSSATLVSLFANGLFLKNTSVANATNWTISGLNLSSYSCALVTASASDAGKCITNGVSGVTVSRVAVKPIITTIGCAPSSPVTSISGNSVEADGTIITLYKTNSGRTSIGTATVSGGTWTISSLNLVSGDNIVAAVTGGSCLMNSPDSDPVTISARTTLLGYTVTMNAITEKQSTVSGTISGGTYPVILKVYIDETQIGSGIPLSGTGSWSVTGLLSTDLYIGGTIKITLTGSGCESDFSSALATVQCQQPTAASYTGGNYNYCYGNPGSLSLTTSQTGVVYQLVNSAGVVAGPSFIGTGSAVTLGTYALTSDLTNIYVKAYKTGYPSCAITASTVINFTPQLPSPSVTFSTTNVSALKGTTSVNLPFTAKSGTPSADTYTVDYSILARAQGFTNITSPTAIPAAPGNIVLTVPNNPATGIYYGTITVRASSGSSCSSSYSFSVTVYGASSPPIICLQPVDNTICNGNSTNIDITAFGAGTLNYQWKSSSSYGGAYGNVTGGSGATSASYTTAGLTSTSYYQVTVSNAWGSTTSTVATITVNSIPTATGSISGSASLCAGQSTSYNIPAIADATSYEWAYDGSNAIIHGNTNPVTIDFAPNATSGSLTVKGNNNCGSGNQLNKGITVNPAPFINNKTITVCSGVAFTVIPANGADGIVPAGTSLSWAAPVVTGGLTGGASGSGTSISGTLTNSGSSTQTATYTITPVKGGCTGNTFTFTVNVNPVITLLTTPVNLLCNSISTGSINVSVSGGTPAFTYAWTGPGSFSAATKNLSGIAVGTYYLTITDSKSCTAATSATVNEPAVLTITPTVTPASCNGVNDGAIALVVSGGTGTKKYLWNDGNTSQNRTGLAVGSYSVTVTDANVCVQSSSGILVSQPSNFSVSGAKTNVLCYGQTNGTITPSVTGGSTPFSYIWNDASTSKDRTGLTAGTYSIKVTDTKGCIATSSFTVTQPTLLSLSTAITAETCPSAANGAINLIVNGGTSPFTYDWADLSSSEPEDRSGLSAGTYTVTVTDANSCTANTSAVITTTNSNPVAPSTIK